MCPTIWAFAITSYSFSVPERAGNSLGVFNYLRPLISMMEPLAGMMELCNLYRFSRSLIVPNPPRPPGGPPAPPGS